MNKQKHDPTTLPINCKFTERVFSWDAYYGVMHIFVKLLYAYIVDKGLNAVKKYLK